MNKIILAIVLLFQEYRLLIRIIKGIGVIIYSYSVIITFSNFIFILNFTELRNN